MKSFNVELKWFRKYSLKMSQSDLGRLLKTSGKTIGKLERGQQKPTPRQKKVLMRLACLSGKLNPINGKSRFKNKKGCLKWLENPLRGLDNFRPVDCLETKEKFQRLLALLKEIGIT